MLLGNLRFEVMKANQQLQANGLVIYTWGNVSAIDRQKNLVVIKPSGVSYDKLTPEKMVIVDLDGTIVDGKLKPSSDLVTHLELFKAFPEIGGVVHTHSSWATIWAQACQGIPCKGTTHADYFFGEVPCTRKLTEKEVLLDYELNTGKVIVESFKNRNYKHVPAVLVAEHGPFTWGEDAFSAVHNSTVLEQVAKMAYFTQSLAGHHEPISSYILNKHHSRKHGPDAYYGQD